MSFTLESTITLKLTPIEWSRLLEKLTESLTTDASLEALHEQVAEAQAVAAWKRDNHSLDLSAANYELLNTYLS